MPEILLDDKSLDVPEIEPLVSLIESGRQHLQEMIRPLIQPHVMGQRGAPARKPAVYSRCFGHYLLIIANRNPAQIRIWARPNNIASRNRARLRGRMLPGFFHQRSA